MARIEAQSGTVLVSAAALSPCLLLTRDGLTKAELRLALCVFSLLKYRKHLLQQDASELPMDSGLQRAPT